MNDDCKADLTRAPVLNSHYRLQWEQAQNAWILLYPEGMIRLSESAAAVLRLVDSQRPLRDLIGKLEAQYPGVPLAQDVTNFVEHAYQRGWLR